MLIGDRDLVKLVLSGDGDAFRTLFDRYYLMVWRVAWRLTQSRGDEDDVVQDTFLRAWRKLWTFHARSTLPTWLTRIAVNCALAFCRARERQAFPRLLGRDVASPDPDPERLAISSEAARQFVRTMRMMTEMERTAFSLHHLDGMTEKETAAELGVSKDAARQAIYRALKKLRADLEPYEVKRCI